MAIVLVQTLREEARVFLLEPLAPFLHELDLRGNGAFEVGHWDDASRGCLPEGTKAGSVSSIIYLPGCPQHSLTQLIGWMELGTSVARQTRGGC